MLEHAGCTRDELTGAVIASVVPPLTPVFESFACLPESRSSGSGSWDQDGCQYQVRESQRGRAGQDSQRVAAYHKYGGPVIVVDFGTATTFDDISRNGDYMGGAIAPGVMTATDALFSKAARLPRIELVRPPQAIGKTTVQSMQSGIIFGFAGQTDALVKRISAELGGNPRVVATGGLAQLVAAESETITDVDPTLTLEGLHLIHKMNARA